MSFEGIPRPSQLIPYADTMSPYQANHAAADSVRGIPKVKHIGHAAEGKAVHRKTDDEQHQNQEEQQHQQNKKYQPISEHERKVLEVFGEELGPLCFTLEDDKTYALHRNPTTKVIELIDIETETVLYRLTANELVTLAQQFHQYAGILTDRSA